MATHIVELFHYVVASKAALRALCAAGACWAAVFILRNKHTCDQSIVRLQIENIQTDIGKQWN